MSHRRPAASTDAAGTPRPRARRRRAVAATAATLALATGLLAGCGDDDGGEGGDEGVRTIEITVEDGRTTPSGERVRVGVDQPVDLVVTADRPGEIHVHADPEQSFPYAGGGETTTIELQISRPGVVEVEDHELDELIVSLEVR